MREEAPELDRADRAAPESPPALDVVMLVSRRWRTMGVLGAIGLAVGVGYVIFAPKWYEARLTVVPSQRSKDVTSALTASLPIIGGVGGAMQDDLQRIHAVLTSRSVADAVIEKFDLTSRYGTDYLERAREELWEHCVVNFDRKSVVVELTCEDHEPEHARQMASYFGEVGNKVFGRISVSSAGEERRFLEAQVLRARHEVDAASEAVRKFQETHRIIDLAEQSKAVISAMASLQGQLLSKRLELDYVSGFASRTEAGVTQLREQIAVMEAQLATLEAGRATPKAVSSAGAAPGGSFFPGAMDVPALRVELEQLFRHQKVQETVFLMLTQRLEMARVDEARDTSMFQILDRPKTPTYRSRPKTTKIAAAGLFVGLAGAAVWILGPAWWRRRTLMSRAGL